MIDFASGWGFGLGVWLMGYAVGAVFEVIRSVSNAGERE